MNTNSTGFRSADAAERAAMTRPAPAPQTSTPSTGGNNNASTTPPASMASDSRAAGSSTTLQQAASANYGREPWMTGSADSIERKIEQEQEEARHLAATIGPSFTGSADRMQEQAWRHSYMADNGAQVQLSEDGCAPALLARLFLGSNSMDARVTSSQLMYGERVEINGIELYVTEADRAEIESMNLKTDEERVEAYLQMGLKNALADASNVPDGGVTGAGTRKVLTALGLDNRVRTSDFLPGSLVAYGNENEKHLMMVTSVEGGMVTLRDGYGREVKLPENELLEFSQRSPDDRYGYDNALAQTGNVGERRRAPRPTLPAAPPPQDQAVVTPPPALTLGTPAQSLAPNSVTPVPVATPASEVPAPEVTLQAHEPSAVEPASVVTSPTHSENPAPSPAAEEPKPDQQAGDPEPPPAAEEAKPDQQAGDPEPPPAAEEAKPDQQAGDPVPPPAAEEPKPDQQAGDPVPPPAAEEPKPDQQAGDPVPPPAAEEPKPDQQAGDPEPPPEAAEPKPDQQAGDPEPPPEAAEPKPEITVAGAQGTDETLT